MALTQYEKRGKLREGCFSCGETKKQLSFVPDFFIYIYIQTVFKRKAHLKKRPYGASLGFVKKR